LRRVPGRLYVKLHVFLDDGADELDALGGMLLGDLRPSSEPTVKNYGLEQRIAQHRVNLRRTRGGFEQLDTGERRGVEMAERVGVKPTIFDRSPSNN